MEEIVHLFSDQREKLGIYCYRLKYPTVPEKSEYTFLNLVRARGC